MFFETIILQLLLQDLKPNSKLSIKPRSTRSPNVVKHQPTKKHSTEIMRGMENDIKSCYREKFIINSQCQRTSEELKSLKYQEQNSAGKIFFSNFLNKLQKKTI